MIFRMSFKGLGLFSTNLGLVLPCYSLSQRFEYQSTFLNHIVFRLLRSGREGILRLNR